MDDLTAFIAARLDEDKHIATMAAEDALRAIAAAWSGHPDYREAWKP